MTNANIAIHSPLEISKKKRELESTWEHFVKKNQKPEKIRSTIYHSWKRSQEHGVNPHQKRAPAVLPEDKLAELMHRSQLYRVSQPVLKELEKQILGTEHLITLCDNEGHIIYLQGEHRVLNKAEEMNFVLGADWSEKMAGSNAIGTCIATEQPIQIFAYEHFCEGAHPWICSAAPIRDPLTGELLGVFDLTGLSDFAQPHSLGLAQNIATLIQQSFTKISKDIRQRLLDCYDESVKKWHPHSTIVLDAMLNVVMAGSFCLSLLHIEDWRQLWSHPELERLKRTIISCNEKELEMYLSSFRLSVHVQRITYESDCIGFLIRLEKSRKHQFSQSAIPKAWRNMIGQSKAFKSAIEQAQIAAPTNVPILINGESGTGKERFAQAIHKASLRHRAPLIALNCGAIPKELMASELFGYEPGVFTGGNPKGKKGKFEEADGGTLLLDEVGEMPLDLQVHLLRVLQEKEIVRLGAAHPIPVDVRIIAATNKNLNELIDEGLFRTDLYFRLNVVELNLPPLRKRKEDIPSLCHYFAVKSAHKLGKPVPTIDKEVLSFFRRYHWPGNIRQLENTMKYATLFCADNHITLSSLPESLQTHERAYSEQASPETLTLLEREEKRKIVQLLMETDYNVSEVARRCGIARTTLYRRMKKYNLR